MNRGLVGLGGHARPTTRVADVVNALHWWVPLQHPLDRAPSLVAADVPERVRAFVDAYGLSAAQRAEVVPVAVRRAANSTLVMRAAADVDPVFRRWWETVLGDRLPRTEAWLADNGPQVARALR